MSKKESKRKFSIKVKHPSCVFKKERKGNSFHPSKKFQQFLLKKKTLNQRKKYQHIFKTGKITILSIKVKILSIFLIEEILNKYSIKIKILNKFFSFFNEKERKNTRILREN